MSGSSGKSRASGDTAPEVKDGKGSAWPRRPTWYTAAASRRDDGRYRGDYFFSTGRPLATIANAPASLTTTAQGVIEIDFNAAGQLDFAFTPNAAATQHRLLQPLPLAATPLVCTFTSGSRAGASNYSDLWWNPNENG